MKITRLLMLLAVVIAVSLNLSCRAASSQEAKAGGIAPDFTLSDLEGNEFTLSQFKHDKNVLIVFGATWCPYCVEEIPELKKIYETFKDDKVKLMYIDIQESPAKVGSFVKEKMIPYTVLLDTGGKVASSYKVRGIPHQVVVDKKGKIYYEGPRPAGGLLPLVSELAKK